MIADRAARSGVPAARRIAPVAGRVAPGPALLTLAGVTAATAFLVALFGLGAVGADGQFALLWGHQLVSGQAVELGAPYVPTPHPLTIVLGGLVALAAGPDPVALSLVQLAALASMGAALWWLTHELFGRAAAWVSVALLVLSPSFAVAAATGPQDALYVGLLLVAARMELRRPATGAPVLAVLALAGLVRPEAWVLAAAYAAALWLRGARRPRDLLIVVAAPAVWVGTVWAATGHPLASLHATRELRVLIGRDSGVAAAVTSLPGLLTEISGPAIPLAGLAGIVLALRSGSRRARPLVAALGLLILLFLVQAAAGFSVIQRYLLAVDAGLLPFAAAVLAGRLPAGRDARATAAVAAAVLWLGVAATLGERREAHTQARELTAGLAESWRRLDAVLPATAGACGQLNFAGPADWRPIVALRTGVSLRDVRLSSVEAPVPGSHLVPVSAGVREAALHPGYVARWTGAPADATVLARTASWELSTTCPVAAAGP